MPRTLEDFAVFSAPAVFVLLWASGFIGAKLGLGYAEPLTFLALRMITVVVLLAIVIAATRPKWPHANGLMHSAATGLMVHGLYLGGVFVAIENGLSAGLVALIVSLQPVLTSTVANRWLGERVVARQWLAWRSGSPAFIWCCRPRSQPARRRRWPGSRRPWRSSASPSARFIKNASAAASIGGRLCASNTRRPELCFASARSPSKPASCISRRSLCLRSAGSVLVLSLGAVWLLYFLIRRAAATRVVSLFYLTPPVTALMAWALFDEKLAPLSLLGMAVCVAGVFLVNWRPRGAAAMTFNASRRRRSHRPCRRS